MRDMEKSIAIPFMHTKHQAREKINTKNSKKIDTKEYEIHTKKTQRRLLKKTKKRSII